MPPTKVNLMVNSVVHLFCDTNLLLQCKPLEELDWSAWDSYEVQVIVTKPILREVDHRKNQGNSRVARRARTANTTFRKMRPSGVKVVRDANPRVTLNVQPQHKYSSELADTLNYEERDDQLVGTLHRFVKENPDTDARLLTHDTTPLYTAESVGLKAETIPAGWLLPPERDEQQKKIGALQEEVKQLRRAEPLFDIRFLDTTGDEAKNFEAHLDLYEPLTGEEVSDLMDPLRGLHPMTTDFGPPKTKHPLAAQMSQISELSCRVSGHVYSPPSDEKVAKYRNEAYPDWLRRCEQMLLVLHYQLQRQQPIIGFCFSAENCGTRPAASALVTIEARGGFQTMAARHSKDSQPIRLPSPPKPPQGNWRNPFDFDLGTVTTPSIFDPGGLVDSLRPAPSRDPNEFYYKSDKPLSPADSISLSCEQWRHADGQKDFLGEIWVPPGSGEVNGALKLRIQAENLSGPAERTIPVRIQTKSINCYPKAMRLVKLVENKKKG